MRIVIIASHAWPLPSPARTGDSQVILDLSRSLYEMGHEVAVIAPKGSKLHPGVKLLGMPLSSNGQAEPTAEECEWAAFKAHGAALAAAAVVHDCSVEKRIAKECLGYCGREVVSTIWGGPWRGPTPLRNVVACSKSQAERLLRGATDYENTPTPDAGGPPSTPLNGVRVAYLGIDTELYREATCGRGDRWLWLNRWHPVKGYREAIQVAIDTGIQLDLVGMDPSEDHPYQAECAREAQRLAEGHDNIKVSFLPTGEAHTAAKVEAYSRAYALLYPVQFQEPFGLCQIEAQACGCPVMALRIGSTPELGAMVCDSMDELRGILSNTVATLSEESRRLMADIRLLNWWRTQQKFDRFVMARRYVELYREAIAGGWG